MLLNIIYSFNQLIEFWNNLNYITATECSYRWSLKKLEWVSSVYGILTFLNAAGIRPDVINDSGDEGEPSNGMIVSLYIFSFNYEHKIFNEKDNTNHR